MWIPAKNTQMIIITLTDIHANAGAISALGNQLRSADLVLLSGDITHFGHKKEMAGMIGLIRSFNPIGICGFRKL